MGPVARHPPPPPPPAVRRSWIRRESSRPAVCAASAALFAVLPHRPIRKLRCDCLAPPALRVRHAAALRPRAQLQEDLEAVSIASAEASLETKTVRVKFTLEKECLFGQQFFIVGNDPNLGLWDTSSAIPLEWSEGHVWTARLDLPIGKPVKYKFILRGSSGEIEWQPGEDRVLQPWETTKMIVVREEWKNAEKQEVDEEEQGNKGERSIVEQSTPVSKNVLADGSLTNKASTTEELEISTNDKFVHVDADNENTKRNQSNDNAVLVPGLPHEHTLVSGLTREHTLVSGLPVSPISNVQMSEPSTSFTSGDRLADVFEERMDLAVKSNLNVSCTSPRSCESGNTTTKDGADSALKNEEKETTLIKESSVEESIVTSYNDPAVEVNEGANGSIRVSEVVRNDIRWGREIFSNFLSTLKLFIGEST